jgi:hypothetical protein
MSTDSRKVIMVQFIVLCALCCHLCSCATIFAPGKDDITIKTDPEGAEIFDGADFIGETPLTHSFVRDTVEHKELTIRKKGFKSQKLYLDRTLEKVALLNFGFILTTGGATSWGIDALSGHLIRYSPDSYFIELEKETGQTSRKEQAHRKRLRFVITNQDYLKKDIAMGQGEYLRAYYEMSPPGGPFDDYRSYLSRVSGQAQSLLAVNDPVEFHHELERESAFSGALITERQKAAHE